MKRPRFVKVATKLAVCVVAAAAVVGAGSTNTATSGWTVVPSPNLGDIDTALNAVVTVSATDVWAGGTGVFDHWNGTIWNVAQGANLPVGNTFEVNGMARVPNSSPAQLWAVGEETHTSRQMVERWNGHSWSVVTPATVKGSSRLDAVTALSPSNAWAVGSAASGALIEHWNGRKWTKSTAPKALDTVLLDGVAAVSANDIWAVGSCSTDLTCRQQGASRQSKGSSARHRSRRHNPPIVDMAVVDHWNGVAWTMMNAPKVSDLFGIAVRSANDIWAVGDIANQYQNYYATASIHWDGKTWKGVTAASPTSHKTYQTLNGVAVGKSNIWAAGYYSGSDGSVGIIERWTGTQWTAVPQSEPPNAVDSFQSVAATTGRGPTWAVGGHIEKWNGSKWTYTPAYNAGTDNSLAALTRVPNSGGQLWAVGQFVKPAGTGPLIERWDGGKWAVVSGPAINNGLLSGVVAAGPSNAWAVGTTNSASPGALIEHWNGTQWLLQKSPGVAHEWSENLNAVAASGPSDVWAAGSWYGASGMQPLVKYWNGSSWSVAKIPQISGTFNQGSFQSIVSLSASNVWAVGSKRSATKSATLTAHWNGSKWSVVSSRNPSSQTNILNGVTAIGPSDVWAAGSATASGVQSTLIERWTGTHWVVVPSANPKGVDRQLLSVSAASGAIWAVGGYDASSVQKALAESWNGAKWQVSPSQSPQGGAILTAVRTGGTPNTIWAAGSYANSSDRQRTLVERHP